MMKTSVWHSATALPGEPTPGVSGTPEEFEILGLSGNTTYFFAMKAADEEQNWSGMSNVVIGELESEVDTVDAPPELSDETYEATVMALYLTRALIAPESTVIAIADQLRRIREAYGDEIRKLRTISFRAPGYRVRLFSGLRRRHESR